jgi:hypothetical protein
MGGRKLPIRLHGDREKKERECDEYLQLRENFLTFWGSAPAGERVPGKPLSVRYYDDIHG